MELKEVFAYAPYSEFSKNVFKIGLMPYSLTDDGKFKSFVFFFEFEPSTESEPMNKEELDEYKAAKKFFGKTKEEQEEDATRNREFASKKAVGLNGMGNTRLSHAGGEKFLGYIFSVASGQAALEWFAKQSAKMPTREQILAGKRPAEYDDWSQEMKNEYIRQYSQHSYEELAELMGVKAKKAASKFQKGPQITDTPDYRRSLPSTKARGESPVRVHREEKDSPYSSTRSGEREREQERTRSTSRGRETPTTSSRRQIPGIPSSRAQPEPGPEKVTPESIRRAINLLFRALVENKIEPGTQFETFIFEDKNGETAKRDDGTPEPMFYSGFAGDRDKVNESVNAALQAHPVDEYYTAVVDPTITLKLVSRVLNP